MWRLGQTLLNQLLKIHFIFCFGEKHRTTCNIQNMVNITKQQHMQVIVVSWRYVPRTIVIRIVHESGPGMYKVK